jgi:hypothetical protein
MNGYLGSRRPSPSPRPTHSAPAGLPNGQVAVARPPRATATPPRVKVRVGYRGRELASTGFRNGCAPFRYCFDAAIWRADAILTGAADSPTAL